MKQKQIWIPVSIAIFLVIAGGIYFLNSKPTQFLTEDALIETINSHYHGSDSIEIQDVVFLGDTHVFVPFNSNGRYGTSFWVWKNRSWKLGEISTIQQPYVWKVDPEDPSTYVAVWNIDPNNDLTQFDIYLLHRRGFSVSNDVHYYIPRVQLNFSVPFEAEGNSYGVRLLPKEWITFLDSYMKVEKSKQPDSSFFDFLQPGSIYFGWMPYDEMGEVSFPSFPGTGSGYGNIHLEYISSIDEYELE